MKNDVKPYSVQLRFSWVCKFGVEFDKKGGEKKKEKRESNGENIGSLSSLSLPVDHITAH